MCFQAGRLIAHQRITGSMRLAKSVGCEMRHGLKYLLCSLGLYPFTFCSGHEFFPDRGHLLIRPYLGHGLAQAVGIGSRKSTHRLCNFQHLFLVDNRAAAFLENRLEQGMSIFDLFTVPVSFQKKLLCTGVGGAGTDQ